MKNNQFILIILFFCVSNLIIAQKKTNAPLEKISNAITEYYKMDRENIHLHLNKSIYLTTEEIWFKGYIIEKKEKNPYAKTSNVYVKLLDVNAKEILSQLYLSENSTFEGNLKIDENFKSGTYYLHVYTNYMNNFPEDESSVSKITIINTNDNDYIDTKKINFNTINVDFFPEGGVFLEGTQNVFSLKIDDCNENGVAIDNIAVLDEKKNIITTFSTDKFGYAKFEINDTQNQEYKISFELNEKKVEKKLPNVILSGYTMSVNNYSLTGKTIIKIKSNKRTLSANKEREKYLVIQQNDNILYFEITFKENKNEEILVINNDQIADGINTIYILDETLKKISERVIFKPSANSNSTEFNVAQKANNKIVINGISPLINGEVSISVLPIATLSEDFENTIINSFIFNNYLENKIKKTPFFINNNNKSKQAQLDNQLIASKTKHNFETQLIEKPKTNFEFDQGLTIKGTVNNDVIFKNKRIKLISISQNLNEETNLDEKNEYFFKNVIAIDSTIVHFSLIDKNRKPIKLNQYAHILNNNQKFLKPLLIEKKDCLLENTNVRIQNIKYPKLKNAISLDSINIKNTLKSKKMTHNNILGNATSRGFKIDDEFEAKYLDILSFIQFHGFNVQNNGVEVIITTRSIKTILGTTDVALFLDNSPIDANILSTLNLKDIDEIYINKSGYGAGSGGSNGVIRIYSKKTGGIKSKANILSQALFIKNGFQPIKKFSSPKYENINTEGFQNFGIIHWEPSAKTDSNGVFNFSIPDLNQKNVKIIIEGISSDGKLISESKILKIQ